MTQLVKYLPAMWETWVQSLGWEDPLEKGMATQSSVLAWRFPWTEETGGRSPWGCRVRRELALEELDCTEKYCFFFFAWVSPSRLRY